MKFGDYVKVKSLQTAAGFRENLQRLGLDMPCDDALEAGVAGTCSTKSAQTCSRPASAI